MSSDNNIKFNLNLILANNNNNNIFYNAEN